MKKKIFAVSIIAFLLLFFSTTICYGADDKESKDMNLGDQITNSMNKVEKSAEDLKNNIKNNNMINGNTDNNMAGSDMGVGNEIRSDYNTTRTAVDTTFNNGAEMTETTWIWIILAIAGIVILATVWFYAMQNSDNE